MLRRHFMTLNNDISYDKDDIVIQYKADKHIKFFGDITEISNPFIAPTSIKVKYDKYNSGLGTYIINTNYNDFYKQNSIIAISNDTAYVGNIGYVVNNNTGDIIYPTDDTIAIITEITILNGGIHMSLFKYYSDFVKKITVKSNNFNIIPNNWCINYNSLEEIELGEGITEIGEGAFRQNPNLKHIILPASVEIIGFDIVNGVSNVEITYLGTKDQWNNIDKAGEWNYHDSITVIHCTDGDIEL